MDFFVRHIVVPEEIPCSKEWGANSGVFVCNSEVSITSGCDCGACVSASPIKVRVKLPRFRWVGALQLSGSIILAWPLIPASAHYGFSLIG